MQHIFPGHNLHELTRLLGLSRRTQVVDIGANPIDGAPPYQNLLKEGLADIVGFEPQVDALEKLNAQKSEHETYLPYAIGDGLTKTLYLTAAPGMTSTLRPDPRLLALFNGFSKFGEIREEITLETQRLDDVEEISNVDFLKIDIQGGELNVFEHASKALDTATVVQTEVAFMPLYEGQPRFGEIEQAMKSRGFVPHTFIDMRTTSIAPVVFNNDPYQGLNQVREADCVFVKDFSNLAALTSEQMQHYAMVIHSCYGSFDLVHLILQALVQRGDLPANAPQAYLGIMSRGS